SSDLNSFAAAKACRAVHMAPVCLSHLVGAAIAAMDGLEFTAKHRRLRQIRASASLAAAMECARKQGQRRTSASATLAGLVLNVNIKVTTLHSMTILIML